MKKLKDIFYDLNDIMVALIIVALAALVIVTNIDTILAYPSDTSGKSLTSEEDTPTNYAKNPPVTDQGDADASGTTESAVGQDTTGSGLLSGSTSVGGVTEPKSPGSTDPGKVENYSIYIKPGSTGDQIADLMIGVGLFTDRKQFNDAVTAAGKDGRLQAGTFIIPSNATTAEVIAIITK